MVPVIRDCVETKEMMEFMGKKCRIGVLVPNNQVSKICR